MCSFHASAELVVIYDSGDTMPIAPYLESLQQPEPSPEQTLPHPAPPMLGPADLRNLLPIRSPGLSPGTVKPQSMKRPFSRPFFILGSDRYSQRWLVGHQEQLEKIGAVGLLVQAESEADVQVIAELAQGLPITPAPGSDIAKALGVSHYPVLVTPEGIEQ